MTAEDREPALPAAVDTRPVLITGGAGFIGTNLAHRLMAEGGRVVVLDNVSRPGVERNLRWLRDVHGPRLRVVRADVRDREAVQSAVANARAVVHLAAQVAVTSSVLDPLHDFDVNVGGTLNVLTALAALDHPPPLLFTSTNKVYGALDDIGLTTAERRYVPEDVHLRSHGIDETRPLDFRSPYGCSKGAADQYVLDFARTFGLKTVVFRMSCVYGPHQYGTEDQGWIAHFLIRALRGAAVTLYGDGMQVRDALFVDDLVAAVRLAFAHIDAVSGQAFNMGGGTGNTTSLLELVELIGCLAGRRVAVRLEEWRPGDQRYYVSDTRRFSSLTGWQSRTDLACGVRILCDWLRSVGVTGTAAAAPAPAIAALVEQ